MPRVRSNDKAEVAVSNVFILVCMRASLLWIVKILGWQILKTASNLTAKLNSTGE